MAVQQHPQTGSFDLLSQTARQRLRARVADAGGDTAAVAREIQAQLDHVDGESLPDTGGTRISGQAERAFLVAQLTYLNTLSQGADQQEQRAKQSRLGWLWQRLHRQRAAE